MKPSYCRTRLADCIASLCNSPYRAPYGTIASKLLIVTICKGCSSVLPSSFWRSFIAFFRQVSAQAFPVISITLPSKNRARAVSPSTKSWDSYAVRQCLSISLYIMTISGILADKLPQGNHLLCPIQIFCVLIFYVRFSEKIKSQFVFCSQRGEMCLAYSPP